MKTHKHTYNHTHTKKSKQQTSFSYKSVSLLPEHLNVVICRRRSFSNCIKSKLSRWTKIKKKKKIERNKVIYKQYPTYKLIMLICNINRQNPIILKTNRQIYSSMDFHTSSFNTLFGISIEEMLGFQKMSKICLQSCKIVIQSM